jgi:hypothetical protein
MRTLGCLAALGLALAAQPAAAVVIFSTGAPDGKMAAASRPSSGGKIEIETGDDFALTTKTQITGATFTGLLSGADLADVNRLTVEIYRVFPADSDVGRTSGPPTFSTDRVPTRVNSPSDVALDSRDSTVAGDLTFTGGLLTSTFSASNSVLDGIHPKPAFNTGGDGGVTGSEVDFSVDFTNPFTLGPGHYFFVPQVAVSPSIGEFYWLSAPRPIVPPGTPFPTGFTDLQAWIRNEPLAPDWLRIGTDIVGGTTFNMAFSLSGAAVPEPAAWGLLVLGFGGAGAVLRRRRAAAFS